MAVTAAPHVEQFADAPVLGDAADVAATLAFAATAVFAQPYPNRPIRIVVPYPPGNASDTVSRLLGEHLAKRLGQQIVVDNRPGASGGVGARLVPRATPDGYTLLMTSTSFTINTAITANLLYDVEKDFEPIAMVSSGGGMVLLTRPDFPAKNVREEIIDALKMPEIVERLRRQCMEPLPALTPQGTRDFLLADMRRWHAAAKAAKLEKE